MEVLDRFISMIFMVMMMSMFMEAIMSTLTSIARRRVEARKESGLSIGDILDIIGFLVPRLFPIVALLHILISMPVAY